MNVIRLVGLLALGVLLSGWWPTAVSAQAQTTEPKGVVTGLQGQATLARPTVAQPVAVKFKDDLFLRDRVDTREDSIVRVLLGGKALVTVRERSSFTVSEESGRAVVDLRSGKIALQAAKGLFRPGESVEIRTPNAVAAVRGSLLITEVKDVGGIPQSSFIVLDATLPITVCAVGQSTGCPSLSPNQSTSVVGVGSTARVGPPQAITPAQASEAASVASGPRGGGHDDAPPAELRTSLHAAKVSEASQLAVLLAPPSPGAAAPAGDAALTQASQPSVTPTTTTDTALVQPPPPATSTSQIGVGATSATEESSSPVITHAQEEAGVAPGGSTGGGGTGGGGTGGSGTGGGGTGGGGTGGGGTGGGGTGGGGTGGGGTTPPATTFTLSGGTKTLAAGESLTSFTGTSATPSTAAIIQITDSTVTGASNNFVQVASGAVATLAGPLFQVGGTSTLTAGSLLDSHGSLSSSTASDFFHLDPTTVTAVDLIRIGSGASLSLGGPLLTDINGVYNVSGDFLAITGGGTVSSAGTAPLFRFTNTQLNVGTAGVARHFLLLTGPGSRLTLAGQLMTSASAPLTVNGFALVGVTNGGVLTDTTTLPLVSVGSAALTLGSGVTGFAFAGGTGNLAGPLLNVSSGAVNVVDRPLVSASGGGRVVTSSSSPLVSLTGGTHSINPSGTAMFFLGGSTTAVDAESGLTVGTDQPLVSAGSLIETTGAAVGTKTVAAFDTSLLVASAPLLSLKGGSNFVTNGNAVDLTLRAKVTSLGPVVRLDNSVLTVNGSLINVAGGSFLKVTGDLIDLSTGARLTVINGALLNVSGGSVVNISGSLVAFGGTLATNAVNVTNSLCSPACNLISGVPVFLTGGAVLTNVSIGSTPIKNPGLGTITTSSPANTALVVVNGPTSKLTITTAPSTIP